MSQWSAASRMLFYAPINFFCPASAPRRAAMDQLRERELIDLIKACTQPVLGICLGMQLLGEPQRRDKRRRAAGHY